MGGEGSIQSMITSLRNNRSLLRKKSMFKREHSFLSTRKEYYKATQGKIDFKKISKEELLVIRNKVIKQRREENLRAMAIVFSFAIMLVAIGIYTSNYFKKEKIKRIEIAKEKYFSENINEYNFLIEEGDKWIDKKNWNNAIYKYKKAAELFPKEYTANYRLALAYSYNCRFEDKDCEIGNILTDQLIDNFPEESKLLDLKNILENKTIVNDVLF